MTTPPTSSRAERARVALLGINHGPDEDWSFWGSFIEQAPDSSHATGEFAGQAELAGQALVSIVQRLGENTMHTEAGLAAAHKVSGLITTIPGELVNAVEEKLNGREWWVSGDQIATQRSLFEIVQFLSPQNGAPAQHLRKLRAADLIRGVEAATSEQSIAVFQAVGTMVAGLDIDGLRGIAMRLAQRSVKEPELDETEVEAELLNARVAVATEAGATAAQAAKPPYELTTSTIGRAAVLSVKAGSDACARWMELKPTVEAVKEVIQPVVSRLPRTVSRALLTWATHVGRAKRTALAAELVSWSSNTSRLMRILARQGIDEREILANLAKKVSTEPSGNRRAELIRTINAIRPHTAAGLALVFDVAEKLLTTDKKIDFQLAQRLTIVLPAGHERAKDLSSQLQEVRKRHSGWTMTTYARAFAVRAQR
jgi:hypothetical protein